MQEPLLVSYMTAAVLNHKTLEDAVAFNMAAKLATPSLIGTQIQALFKQCFEVRKEGWGREGAGEGRGLGKAGSPEWGGRRDKREGGWEGEAGKEGRRGFITDIEVWMEVGT